MDYRKLKEHLLSGGNREEAALLLAGVSRMDQRTVLTVREVIPVPTSGYQTKGGLFLQVDPEFMAPLIKRCRYENASFILTHSHPFSGHSVGFSSVDDEGEEILVPKLKARIPGRPHGFLVFGQDSIAGRMWLSEKENSDSIDIIRVIGERIKIFNTTNSKVEMNGGDVSEREAYHRQILVISPRAQKILEKITIGVVGTGGVGSQVFVQMVHLGVGKIIAIDDEVLEKSNRSRVLASKPEDVKQEVPKVEIMKRYADATNPSVLVDAIMSPIEFNSVAMKLREADVIFCCTDNVRSRVVLNRLSFQYLIPLIDMGVDIQFDHGKIHAAAGRVMLIQPDGPCLECMGIITGEAIDRESNRNPTLPRGSYVTMLGEGEKGHHAPAVVSFNGVVASLSVTRLLDMVSGIQDRRRPRTYEMFLIQSGEVRPYSMEPFVKCTMCKEVKGYADDISLPCELDK
ncbi:MAG: ThiF family adenylyltransferase [Candidatus Hydrothermarchaeales archaeon]